MKIKEFNAENDLLKSSLDQLRTEFLKEINDIIDCLRYFEAFIMIYTFVNLGVIRYILSRAHRLEH